MHIFCFVFAQLTLLANDILLNLGPPVNVCAQNNMKFSLVNTQIIVGMNVMLKDCIYSCHADIMIITET